MCTLQHLSSLSLSLLLSILALMVAFNWIDESPQRDIPMTSSIIARLGMSTAPLYFSSPFPVCNESFPIVSICTEHLIGPKTEPCNTILCSSNMYVTPQWVFTTILHLSSNLEISANLSSCTFTFHKSFNVSSY